MKIVVLKDDTNKDGYVEDSVLLQPVYDNLAETISSVIDNIENGKYSKRINSEIEKTLKESFTSSIKDASTTIEKSILDKVNGLSNKVDKQFLSVEQDIISKIDIASNSLVSKINNTTTEVNKNITSKIDILDKAVDAKIVKEKTEITIAIDNKLNKIINSVDIVNNKIVDVNAKIAENKTATDANITKIANVVTKFTVESKKSLDAEVAVVFDKLNTVGTALDGFSKKVSEIVSENKKDKREFSDSLVGIRNSLVELTGVIEDITKSAELKKVEIELLVEKLKNEYTVQNLVNVTAPSIIEKNLRPGSIRFDAVTGKFRKCDKNGWSDL